MKLATTITTLLLLLGSLSLNAQDFSGPKEDIDAILANIDSFSYYYVHRQTDKVVDSYTHNGKIFPAGRDIMEGKEALTDFWTRPAGDTTTYHKITPLQIKVMGDVAHDYGYYEGASHRNGGPEIKWKGKYVIIWNKVDGQWKMDVDIWNRITLPKEETADEVGIRSACMDYINTFYLVDTILAHRSIDPSLRKMGYYYQEKQDAYSPKLEMSFSSLIDLASTWNSKGNRADANSPKGVQIFEISDKTAIAKVTAVWGVDYISLAKVNDKWMIFNVIWQSSPR